MDQQKIGRLIRRLRKERGWTQLQLAEKMHISDKTVSKWECGAGCPELSLLPELSRLFCADLEQLLAGELAQNGPQAGNMKKMRFHVCPVCGNLVLSLKDAGVSCCGKKLAALAPQKAEGPEKLRVEQVENDFFITASHPMERDHYLSFAALLTGAALVVRKTYPEWDFQVRIPVLAHGTLLWYCTRHGLLYQTI